MGEEELPGITEEYSGVLTGPLGAKMTAPQLCLAFACGTVRLRAYSKER